MPFADRSTALLSFGFSGNSKWVFLQGRRKNAVQALGGQFINSSAWFQGSKCLTAPATWRGARCEIAGEKFVRWRIHSAALRAREAAGVVRGRPGLALDGRYTFAHQAISLQYSRTSSVVASGRRTSSRTD